MGAEPAPELLLVRGDELMSEGGCPPGVVEKLLLILSGPVDLYEAGVLGVGGPLTKGEDVGVGAGLEGVDCDCEDCEDCEECEGR